MLWFCLFLAGLKNFINLPQRVHFHAIHRHYSDSPYTLTKVKNRHTHCKTKPENKMFCLWLQPLWKKAFERDGNVKSKREGAGVKVNWEWARDEGGRIWVDWLVQGAGDLLYATCALELELLDKPQTLVLFHYYSPGWKHDH